MQSQPAVETGKDSFVGAVRRGAPSLIFAALVAAAAVYSFSPRALPDFPATQLQASQILVADVARVGDGYIAVGDRGRILLADSPDGPWRDAEREASRGSTLTAVLQLSPTELIAVGHDLWILRSADAGERWEEVYFDADMPEPLLQVGMTRDAGRIFAIGGFGQYLVSDDRGQSWQAEQHEAISDYHLNAIDVADDGTLMLVGERGLVLRSQDDGHSWQPMPLDYNGSIFGTLPLGGASWLAFGMRGNAFRSDDHGERWTRIEMPTENSLFGGLRLPGGEVVLVGAMNTVLLSDAGLNRFEKVADSKQGALASVIRVDDDTVLVAGENGVAKISLREAAASAGGAP